MQESAPQPKTQLYQELAYAEGHDYRSESPHLNHPQLYGRLLAQLRETLRGLEGRGLPLTVLDVGAGDGAFVEPLLAYGCEITATEMSRPSIARLEELYRRSPQFEVAFDGDGSLAPLGTRRFSLILFASVLHHIPDYVAALESAVSKHLLPGGVLMSLQDPLWYPSLSRGVHAFSEVAFLSWRLTQGNLMRGVRSRARRLRNAYSENEPSDMVEYHVVRKGVDQTAISSLLQAHFEDVEVVRYWSAHAPFWQRVGERLPVHNTFAIAAENYDGRPLA